MEERCPMDRTIGVSHPSYPNNRDDNYHAAAYTFDALRAGRETGKVEQAWAYANARGRDVVEMMRFFCDNYSRVEVSLQKYALVEALKSGHLALVKLLVPWYFQTSMEISPGAALKYARRSGSREMVEYILDSFQARYTRQIDCQFQEWKGCLEEQLLHAAAENHFSAARLLERYWLQWTSRHSDEELPRFKKSARLLEQALDSESEIFPRFVLNSDMVKRDISVTPETSQTNTTEMLGRVFDQDILATAIIRGNMFVIKQFVASGVDFGARVTAGPLRYSNFDWSPIHRGEGGLPQELTPWSQASFKGHGEVVQYLLAAGTNPKLAQEELSRPVPDSVNLSLVKLIMDAPVPM